jgi:hypothetical protein
LRFFGREDIETLLTDCGLVWQRWETVQLDPSEAELSHFWHNLEPFDQDFLRIKCEDGLVYQHVLRAYPTHVKGKSIELQKDTEDEARIFQLRAQALHALITSLEELKQAHALAEKKMVRRKSATQAKHRAAGCSAKSFAGHFGMDRRSTQESPKFAA